MSSVKQCNILICFLEPNIIAYVLLIASCGCFESN